MDTLFNINLKLTHDEINELYEEFTQTGGENFRGFLKHKIFPNNSWPSDTQ